MYNLKAIKELILEKTGIDLSYYRDNYLERRIRARMRKNNLTNFNSYIEKLEIDIEERKKFIDEIGINVSYFFRNKSTFEQIKNIVFPHLKIKERVYIWSAGCASGEEPYSIAILLKEEGIETYKIYATDIDNEVLEKAKEGIYGPDKFIETPIELKNKYFVKIEGNFKISEDLKKNITFFFHDITKKPPLLNFDLVLCRNVIIYFIKEKQRVIFENLYSSLKRDGFLVLGKTEFLPFEFLDKFEYVSKTERILKKI
ncbi:MAG: protein-glutamate O-methyltransferase CheR [Candidatus Hydrothermales bacterium]